MIGILLKKFVEKGFIKDVVIDIIAGIGTKDHQQIGVLEQYFYKYLSKSIDIKELTKSVQKSNIFLIKK